VIFAEKIADANQLLSENEIKEVFHKALEGKFKAEKLLILIPDHTRTIPLAFLFRLLCELLAEAKELKFMVALGTHPPLSEASLNKLVGITAEERAGKYKDVKIVNHKWDEEDTFVSIGTLPQSQIKEIAGERWHHTLGGDVDVIINKAALEADQVLILGPTFPHEVVGFSGGAKYLFPGISGADMINVTHWLGALAGVRGTIGIKDTPVRAMIHAATEHLKTPLTLMALTVVDGGLAGVFIGDHISAWQKAADYSAERHINWVDKPFKQVLSRAPAMYDELWTAGKAMYKLEPALAKNGELIIYAPHLSEVSFVHGKYIRKIGYHVLDYFLKQWDDFKDIPLGVLAHSTHVRGDGEFIDGIEYPRARVTLSSQISQAETEALGFGYLDPKQIKLEDYKNREDEGILYVAKAGEMLYKVKRNNGSSY